MDRCTAECGILLAVVVALSFKTLFSYLEFSFNKQVRSLYAENDHVGDYLTGLAYFNQGAEKEIRLNNLQNWFMKKILKYRGEMLNLQCRDFRRYALFESLRAILMTGQSLVVLLILANSYIDGIISIADFTMYFSAVTALSTALNTLTQLSQEYRIQI